MEPIKRYGPRDRPVRLAVVVTHPIQYYAPLFRLLTQRDRLKLRVFYGWRGGSVEAAHDHGFGQAVQWDVPLLDGYDHVFIPNESKEPGTHHFRGIRGQSLINEIRHWGADALLVYGWSYSSHLAALRWFHGRLPVFFRGDSTLLNERPGPRRWARRFFLRWVYSHVDYALFVGQRNKAYYEAHGLRPSQLVWAPHSIDDSRFEDLDGSLARQAETWRSQLAIGEQDIVYLFAGKLEPIKAPGLLIDQFVRYDRPHEHLVIVGSGPLESELRSRARDRRNVHFLGFQNQSMMPVVYRLADVYVLPSRSDTWGLAVNEAMCCGVPAITSDRVGCAVDLVIPGETGYVFRDNEPGDLNRAMIAISESREHLCALGRNAQQLVKNWSLREQAMRIEEAIIANTPLDTAEA